MDAFLSRPRSTATLSAHQRREVNGDVSSSRQLWSAHGSRTLWLGLFLPSPSAAIRCTVAGLVCPITRHIARPHADWSVTGLEVREQGDVGVCWYL